MNSYELITRQHMGGLLLTQLETQRALRDDEPQRRGRLVQRAGLFGCPDGVPVVAVVIGGDLGGAFATRGARAFGRAGLAGASGLSRRRGGRRVEDVDVAQQGEVFARAQRKDFALNGLAFAQRLERAGFELVAAATNDVHGAVGRDVMHERDVSCSSRS